MTTMLVRSEIRDSGALATITAAMGNHWLDDDLIAAHNQGYRDCAAGLAPKVTFHFGLSAYEANYLIGWDQAMSHADLTSVELPECFGPAVRIY